MNALEQALDDQLQLIGKTVEALMKLTETVAGLAKRIAILEAEIKRLR